MILSIVPLVILITVVALGELAVRVERRPL